MRSDASSVHPDRQWWAQHESSHDHAEVISGHPRADSPPKRPGALRPRAAAAARPAPDRCRCSSGRQPLGCSLLWWIRLRSAVMTLCGELATAYGLPAQVQRTQQRRCPRLLQDVGGRRLTIPVQAITAVCCGRGRRRLQRLWRGLPLLLDGPIKPSGPPGPPSDWTQTRLPTGAIPISWLWCLGILATSRHRALGALLLPEKRAGGAGARPSRALIHETDSGPCPELAPIRLHVREGLRGLFPECLARRLELTAPK